MAQRGRKKGGKNRSKAEIEAEKEYKASLPKRGRGRPKGSKNHTFENDMLAIKEGEVPAYSGRGRPRGTGHKNKRYTVSEKALAQRQESRMLKDPKTDEEINYNSRLIDHIMGIHEIASHADRSDLLSLKSCFVAYLKLCQESGMVVSNLTAYAAMGFDYAGFNSFSRKDDQEVRAFCAFVRETCAMFRENMVAGNKLNPVIGIFWQRNFDGLRNDTEQVQSLQEQEEYNSGGNSYKEKYKNLIGG